MATLAEIRAKHPEYNDLPDQELADRIYQKFYSDMPRGEFDYKLGLNPAGVGQAPNVGFGKQIRHTPGKPFTGGEVDPVGVAKAFTGGVVGGLPVVGPTIEEWVKDLADHLASSMTGRPQSEIKAHNDLVSHDIDEAHPIARGAGELTGGGLGYGAAAKVAPWIVGAGPGSLLTRSIGSGAANSLIGAADTAARGGSPSDIGHSAGVGAALGSLVPGVGAAIGAAARPIARGVARATMPGISGLRPSAAKVMRNAQAMEPTDVPTRLRELGPEATWADAGPTLRGVVHGITRAPGVPRSTVLSRLNAREAGATGRILGDMDTAFGPARNPMAADRAFKAERSIVHDEIDPALSAVQGPIDVSHPLATIASSLDKTVGPENAALQKVRNLLTEEIDVPATVNGRQVFRKVRVPITDPFKVQSAKKGISDLIDFGDDSIGVKAGMLASNQGAFKLLRSQVDRVLRDQVPGYASIMDRSSAIARRIDQIPAGQQVLDGGKAAIRPDELATEWAALSPEEQAAKKLGTRSDVDRIVRQTANDRIALKKVLGGEGDWNREKLATMYGGPSADRALATADREATFFDTKHRLVDNSETAAGVSAERMMNPSSGGTPHLGAATAAFGGAAAGASYVALKGIAQLWDAAKNAMRSGRNNDIARAITSGNQVTLAEALAKQNERLGLAGQVSAPRIDALARALLGYEGSMRQGSDFAPLAKPAAIGAGLILNRFAR